MVIEALAVNPWGKASALPPSFRSAWTIIFAAT